MKPTTITCENSVRVGDAGDSYLLQRDGIKLLQHVSFLLFELSHRFCKRGLHPLVQMGLHSKDATFHMFEMHAAAVSSMDATRTPV
jgi:hypothetical protein